jgi:hypothetical protein
MTIGIQTKFLPATNKTGARIKAFTSNGHTATIPFDYSLHELDAHFAAVLALKEKNSLDYWNLENMTYGGTKDGYFFTFAWSHYQRRWTDDEIADYFDSNPDCLLSELAMKTGKTVPQLKTLLMEGN